MRTAGRVLLTAILCVLLVGFGLCGAYGTLGGLSDGMRGDWSGGLLVMMLGALGLSIAWLCWRAIAGVWRKPPAPPLSK